MTNPDAAENKAFAATHAIADQAIKLWWAAHYDGVRNGLEAAAQVAQAAIDGLKDNYQLPAEIRLAGVELLQCVRDNIRLAALQAQEPDPPRTDR